MMVLLPLRIVIIVSQCGLTYSIQSHPSRFSLSSAD